MWQLLCGFGTGIYVGTYYNCKPMLEYVKEKMKEHIPEDIPSVEKNDKTGKSKD